MARGLQGDPKDAVVARPRLGPAVPVRGGHPEGAVRGERDRSDPAVLAREVGCRLPRVGAVQDDRPDALTLERAQPGAARRDRDAAGRALVDGPLRQRVGVPALPVGALDVGPAVVLAGLDQVELVGALVAELRGPEPGLVVEPDALDVAMA